MSAWDDRVNEKLINSTLNYLEQDSELKYRQYLADNESSVFDNDPLADNPGYTNSRSDGGVDIYNATANKTLTGTVYADSIANQDGVSYSYIGNLCVGHTFEGCTSLRKFTVSITRQNL